MLEKLKSKLKSVNKKMALRLLLAFILGAVWIIAIRFVTLKKDEVHYHANFAVFIDGERLPLDRFSYYEEVQSCGGDEINNPKTRAHMHDQVNYVVHIHDKAATWGHFFANLGMVDGDSVFKTDAKTIVEDDKTSIRFFLNGQEVDTTANRTIESEDVLLVSIGNSSPRELEGQYSQIIRDAGEYNKRYDPSSCSGGKQLTFTERLKESIGIFWLN